MDHLTASEWDEGMTTIEILTLLTALGAATFGGAMFAFSAFVMHGLDRLPHATAVAAMQQINLSAPRPPLVLVMVGTSLLAVVTAVVSGSLLVIAGCAAYLASVAITGGFHIPRNNALAGVDPTGAGAPAAWTTYSAAWQRGNHLRAASALGGALLLVLSLTR
jgi:uncharacterized membrane protein